MEIIYFLIEIRVEIEASNQWMVGVRIAIYDVQ